MFQLLPFAETAAGSSRILGYFNDFNDARKYLMPLGRMVGLLIPDFYGSPGTGNFFGSISYTEFAFYVGIPPVVFVIYALKFFKRNSEVKFWALTLLVVLVLSVNNPVSRLFHISGIPIYSSLLPSRLLSVVTICLVVLSALGLSAFQKNLVKNKHELRNMATVVGFVFLAFVFFAVDALVIFRLTPEKGAVSLKNIVVPFAFFVFTAAAIFLAKINFKVGACLLIFLVIADLTRQGWKYNTFIDESLVFPSTKSLEFLGGREVPPRVVMSHQELLPAEANVFYGFSLLGGYDSVHSAKTEKLLNTLNYQSVDSDEVSGRVVFVSSLTSRAYDILSPEYYMVLNDNKEKIGNDMELVFSEGRTELYKNKDSYPRAYVAQDVKKVAEEEALPKVLEMAMNRKKAAYATVELGVTGGSGTAELYLDKVNELYIKVNTPKDAVVVVNEAYDPNWKAVSSLGEAVELFEVNYHLIGIKAPAGEYDVALTYSPKSFSRGLSISLFSGFLYAGYLLVLKRSAAA